MLNARLFMQGRVAQRQAAQQGELVGLLLRDFESQASDWLWQIDAQGRLQHVSVRLAESLGQKPELLRGQPFVELLAARQPPDSPDAEIQLGRLARMLQRTGSFRNLDVPICLDGQLSWWSLSGRRLREGAGWRGVGRDVTVLRQREQALQSLATVDQLTGLANRHQFRQKLEGYFDTTTGGPCTLLLLDLDNFKQVNDALGHGAGDQLLAEVGLRLRESVSARRGAGDLMARLGGDEFALILRGELDATAIQRMAKQLRSALAVPVTIDEHTLELRASLGSASAPAHAGSAEELIRAADLALYAAKADGRGKLRDFVPLMRELAAERSTLLAELRRAVDADQLELHYQPQIDLRSGRLRGFEALVRWRHPVRGLVPPATFIPLAEESGVILAIGAWVLRRACEDATRWPEPWSVAVNVSAVEIERGQVEQQVTGALRASGLDPARLELELTESVLLHDTTLGIDILGRLRGAGVQLALDDFGTGFSSLAYLRRLPLDKLKIDRAFVVDLDREGASDKGRAIVCAIRDLAAALGLETVAEGIETPAQLAELEELGCSVGQGYLFARPMPAAAMQDFIDNVERCGATQACQLLVESAIHIDLAQTPVVKVPSKLGPIVQIPDTRWGGLL